jgi:mono/diheme cytochrome c family protein
MKSQVSLLVIISLISSCTQITPNPKTPFEEEVQIRHGIIPSDNALLQKLDSDSVSRGKVLYEKNCIGCHGEKGGGDGKDAYKQKHSPAKLNNLARDVSDFTFFMSISRYQGQMPGWKKAFTNPENDDLVAYIKSFAIHKHD